MQEDSMLIQLVWSSFASGLLHFRIKIPNISGTSPKGRKRSSCITGQGEERRNKCLQ